MKHKLCVWIATLLALCLCLSFAGCADVSAENEGGGGTTPHTHTFAAGWSHDEEKHWHAATCGHDTQRSGEAAHTYVNGKCSECNYEHVNHAFEYSEETETEHTGTCSVCGKTVTEAHNYENGVCTECHFMHKNHTYGDDNTCSTCGKKLYTKSADSKKVYFGEYPQTKVTDANDSDMSLRNSLNMAAGIPLAGNRNKWTDYGYYIEGAVTEYMWYIDVDYQSSRYRGVYFTRYRPWYTTNSSSADNSYQDDCGYNLNTVYWFKFEPIKWRILEQKDGKALLMADSILDCQQFYHNISYYRQGIDKKTIYANDYKESDIRAWLNGTFYETAFDEHTEQIIETTTVDEDQSKRDKVFLLSSKDIMNTSYGFNSHYAEFDMARWLESTSYADSQGMKLFYYGYGPYVKYSSGWWLRSPSPHDPAGVKYYNTASLYVDYNGERSYYGAEVDITFGVVPALWIKL